MDPDETLELMRKSIQEGQRLSDEADRLCDEANDSGKENDEFAVRDESNTAFAAAAEHAHALDMWIMSGGSLPTAWELSR